MTTNRLYLLVSLCSASLLLPAQAPPVPVSRESEPNNLRFTLNSNGAMFHDLGTTAGRFVPVRAGLAPLSLLRGSGVWFGGRTPTGGIRGAAQVFDGSLPAELASDFAAGALGVPPADPMLNDIWTVGCGDIAQQLADLADNGVLDAPVASVMGWPSTGNPFFNMFNNGASLPSPPYGLADFFDADGNGYYDPLAGDYPEVELRGCPFDIPPNLKAWFLFHDLAQHPLSGLEPAYLEIQTEVFTYKSPDPASLFNNTVFVRYKLVNLGATPLDSCYLGLFTDFSIGNAYDDFGGCDTAYQFVYAYNGDNDDADGFGASAPAVGINLLRGPLGPDAAGELQELRIRHVLFFDEVPLGQPQGFYNLLRGRWSDGAPAPNGGLMYPGNPNTPGSNSEPALGNTPGRRMGLVSFGPFRLLPGRVNELIVGYHYAWSPGATPLQNVQALYDQSAAIQGAFDLCFTDIDATCDGLVRAPEAPLARPLRVFPSPAASEITVESPDAPLGQVRIFDSLGRLVRDIRPGSDLRRLTLPIADLAPGTYVVLAAGQQRRVVVQR